MLHVKSQILVQILPNTHCADHFHCPLLGLCFITIRISSFNMYSKLTLVVTNVKYFLSKTFLHYQILTKTTS